MSWYAAHIIMAVKYKEGSQDRIPVYENVVLIEAPSDDEAEDKAARRGQEAEGDDSGTFKWDGRPARRVFAGVRKIIACVEAEQRPADGTEITYSEMEVASEEELSKLVNGETVSVVYEE